VPVFGYARTNIKGAVSSSVSKNFTASPTGFSKDFYRRADRVTYKELTTDIISRQIKVGGAVAARLPVALHSTRRNETNTLLANHGNAVEYGDASRRRRSCSAA
jgi:hypothetical protein